MMPTEGLRSASRRTPRIFIRLFMRLSKSPRPDSSIPIFTSRVERRSIRDRPGHGLDQTVDAGLIVGLDDRERRAGTGEHILELLFLLGREGFGCGSSHDNSVHGHCVDSRMLCTCRPDDKACLTGQERVQTGEASCTTPWVARLPAPGAGVSVRALAGRPIPGSDRPGGTPRVTAAGESPLASDQRRSRSHGCAND